MTNAYTRKLVSLSLQDGYNITYQRLVVSDLPKVRRIDVEKSDEENMIISMDIEAQFSADVTVDRISTVTESRLNVTLMQTRIECKLSRQNIEDNMIHIRQTGHVNLEAAWSEPETDCEALNLIQLAIINVLKSVDCDLPPLAELCQVRIANLFCVQTHLCLVAAHQKNLLFTQKKAEKAAQKFAYVLHTVTKSQFCLRTTSNCPSLQEICALNIRCCTAVTFSFLTITQSQISKKLKTLRSVGLRPPSLRFR